MARHRNQKDTKLKLAQPDRSGPDPSRETLFDIAEKRGLLSSNNGHHARHENADNEEPVDPPVGRLGEAILWSTSLTMLHFTFDVLVANQYAVEISWPKIITRAAQAFPVILLLFYTLHPHPSPSGLLPTLDPRLERLLHQMVFFAVSVAAGTYLIYITNEHGYYAIMKRAPPMGCLWIWSVIELNLLEALGSLICCGVYLRWKGYSYV